MTVTIDAGRVRRLAEGPPGAGPVLYWMQRDQRAHDNWALLHAQQLALARNRPLVVVFCLATGVQGAPRRHYRFMLEGLRETAADLAAHGIGFVLRRGLPGQEIPACVTALDGAALVIDVNPLRIPRRWRADVLAKVATPVDEVDAHNVVPLWQASGKQEYAARTMRPKVTRLLPRYLVEIPPLHPHPHAWSQASDKVDVAGLLGDLRPADHGPSVTWIVPGARAAAQALDRFVQERLVHYDAGRNDPTVDLQSDLSPYFHFGQLAPQRAALAAARHAQDDASRDAYLEELIVRRELSDNFCHYNPDYDDFGGFPDWAQRTLSAHADDPREYVYGRETFEAAATHDPLWNAAQQEMVVRGKMHGYLRMYWAKQILAWSRDPAEALATAIALNDRYELDGRDPNGYVGCAWSVGGVHDRPWIERPVFGTIRCMTRTGCQRKFRVDRYIDQVARLVRESA